MVSVIRSLYTKVKGTVEYIKLLQKLWIKWIHNANGEIEGLFLQRFSMKVSHRKNPYIILTLSKLAMWISNILLSKITRA